MAAFTPISERMAQLLADEAAGGIDDAESAELQSLMASQRVSDRDQMMRVASLAQLALLRQDRAAQVTLPDALRTKLLRQADAWQSGRQASGSGYDKATATKSVADLQAARQRRIERPQAAGPGPVATRPVSSRSALGWYLAAALAVAFVVVRLQAPDEVVPVAAVSLEAQREALLSQAPDLVQLPWGASDQSGFEQARGDVVWSTSRQEGFLRLSGLPVNDASRDQYQLWVVDASRDVHPVDGGVFDITGEGELIIPINVKLPVSQPSAFAVTLEKPGGVVVSDGPMLLVAAVGS